MHEGTLGNWIAVKFASQEKTIAITNACQIPSSSLHGNKCSLAQCNLIDGQSKSPSQCRKEILIEIEDYANANKEIEDFIIAGDFSQDIQSTEIQRFFTKLGL